MNNKHVINIMVYDPEEDIKDGFNITWLQGHKSVAFNMECFHSIWDLTLAISKHDINDVVLVTNGTTRLAYTTAKSKWAISYEERVDPKIRPYIDFTIKTQKGKTPVGIALLCYGRFCCDMMDDKDRVLFDHAAKDVWSMYEKIPGLTVTQCIERAQDIVCH